MAARQRRPFTVEAIVILPDHLHCIWMLPSGDEDCGLALSKAFTVTYDAVFITLSGRQIMTFVVWRWIDAKGGMRFTFPPYGPITQAALVAHYLLL